jgi:tRNA threonylcarbamoyladenosine biosynthesis protein TsaB
MLLALDTSTRVVGIALYDGSQVISESTWTSHDYHTVELAPAVVSAMQRSGLSVADLKVLAVATGPGSFTGLRIGLALAKGLALSSNLALVGIPSLDVLAAGQAPRPEPMAAVLRAGRGRLAVGWYELQKGVWKASGPAELMSAEQLNERIQSPTLVCGELTEEERRYLARKRRIIILASPANSVRRPACLAELAWKRWNAGQVDDPRLLAPIYLHYNDPVTR